MARPLRIEYPSAFYHITSRGNERKEIFKSNRDREKFLDYLETASNRYGAVIHVYCLMTNHYHLLLETPRGNLSQIMRHINGAYTAYFNKKRQRAGHLFQGRYRAILVDADAYAQELSRYIHLNPVRAGMVESPKDYLWSSYRCYAGQEKKQEWLLVDFILGYFGKKISTAKREYRKFVNAMVGKVYESPLENTVASTLLGRAHFVQEIKEKYLSGSKHDRNLPALRELTDIPSLDEITERAQSTFSDEPELWKKVALYMCHRHSGKKLKEIGSYFGMGESAVSQASRRFGFRLEKDGKLVKKISEVNDSLGMSNV